MLRLALKAIKHNPKRLILTSIAVVLGVALVTTIQTFTNSIGGNLDTMFEEISTGRDISIAQADSFDFSTGNRDPFPEDVYDTVLTVDGVAEAYRSVESSGDGYILKPDGTFPPQTGSPNLFYNWLEDADSRLMTIVEGHAPTRSGEAVMDIGGLDRYGYHVGDTLLVATDFGISEYHIVGASQFGEANQLNGATLVHLTLEDTQTLTGFEGQLTDIGVIVADGYDVDAVVENLRTALPDDLDARSSKDLLANQQEGLASVMQIIDIFTLVFALIALFVGSFIIANTFRIVVTQRTQEIGLIRSLGARPSQVRRQILLEALIVALVSSVVGIILGYLLAIGLVAGMEASGNGMGLGTPSLPLDAVLWGLGVGFLVTMASALLPAIHASRISPMEALREAGTQSHKALQVRNVVGLALTALAIAAILVGLYTGVVQPGIWVGAGAAILVFGVALMTAQALTGISRWLHRGLSAMFGINGRLAADNIRRQPRRAGITASALMIGVLLLSLSATVTESAKVSVRDSFAQLVHSDAIVSGNLMGPPVDVGDTAVGIIQSTDGVDYTSLIGLGTATVDDRSIMLGVIEADTIDETYTYPAEPTLSHIGTGAVIGPRMVAWGYRLGDTITVVGQDATLDLTVVGVHTVDGDPDVFVDWPLGQQLDDEIVTWMVMVNFDEGADPDVTLAAIAEGLDEFPLLQALPPDAVAKSFTEFFDQLLIIITVMLSASLIIAILGVANTLFLSITERTRELGLLRAVGVSRKSVRRMVTLESVIMSLFGALLGIALGTGLGVALVIALKSFGLSSVVVPTMWLVVYTVLAILAGIAAAIVPAWQASRIDILKAITTE